MPVTYRRQEPDCKALYRIQLDSDYGYGSYITHYIRFFPDGSLLSVFAPDFVYNTEGCYQEPWYIRELLVPDTKIYPDDPFGILSGTYSIEGGVLTYRIYLGEDIFEEGTGYFYATQWSAIEPCLHLNYRNYRFHDEGHREYGSWD